MVCLHWQRPNRIGFYGNVWNSTHYLGNETDAIGSCTRFLGLGLGSVSVNTLLSLVEHTINSAWLLLLQKLKNKTVQYGSISASKFLTSSSFCWSTMNVSIGQRPCSSFHSLAPRPGRFRRAGFRLCSGRRCWGRFPPSNRCSGIGGLSSLLRRRRAVFKIIGIVVAIVVIFWWCACALPTSRCRFGLWKFNIFLVRRTFEKVSLLIGRLFWITLWHVLQCVYHNSTLRQCGSRPSWHTLPKSLVPSPFPGGGGGVPYWPG